ncbi:hypothetical protein [Actinoplanes sp. NPDC051494]|uniref:hypothetical protein n=1 Tax=Actinoplanes sp. NPDC051494 TaxID=3363907 RepID=UPI0037A341A8
MSDGSESNATREIGWGYSWEDGSFDTWIAYPEALDTAREPSGLIPLLITSPTDTGKIFTTFYGYATLGADHVLRPYDGQPVAGDKFALTLDGKAAVIGYDNDGNPIYSTADQLENDPVEAGDVPADPQFADVNEVEEDATTPVAAKSGSRAAASGPIMGPCVPRRTVTVKNTKNSVRYGSGTQVRNNRNVAAKLTATITDTVTYTMGTSATVSASAKAWIFAEAKAEITGSISLSKTLVKGESIEVTVPKKSTVTVDRGMTQERFSYSYYDIQYSCKVTRGSGSAWAPSRSVWNIH